MYKPAVNLREALEKVRRRERMSQTKQQEESATYAAVQRNPWNPTRLIQSRVLVPGRGVPIVHGSVDGLNTTDTTLQCTRVIRKADDQANNPYIVRIYSSQKGERRKPTGLEMKEASEAEKTLLGLWNDLKAPLEPMTAMHPGLRVGIDSMGPLPMTREGNRYILVTIDYSTKWAEAVAIRFQDASTVAKAFVHECVSRFGAPQILQSDQGAAFESQLLLEVSHLFGVKRTRTTPYHPPGNGPAESTNRTIKGILQGFCETLDLDRWDETLPLCILAYCASYHGTTW
ncbi:unnamed protein product [Echinostoma caproni]|uniref:Integrase catalytic domain-containing protein n=1 Tax=Echinostoma caproni TaxID=27848 RepID=A0A183A0N5_9TREM|nr:unnamed protein product [Echinostoma caproni]